MRRGEHVQVIRGINHNAAVGIDSLGREVVVMGAGVGFGKLPREVPLSQIDRTFVGIDPKYLALIGELPYDVLEFSAQFSDVVRAQVSHELSPNLVVTLADHISFMIKRAREHIYVSMPLSYDVGQNYPVELRLGRMCVHGVERTFDVRLPRDEAAGVALTIVNSALSSSDKTTRRNRRRDQVIERVTKVVERELGITVDRDSFDFARFATHVRYLLERLDTGEPFQTTNGELFEETAQQYPKVAACADKAIQVIAASNKGEVTDEERLYLILHINRLWQRATATTVRD